MLDRGRALVANLRFVELLAAFLGLFAALALIAGIGLKVTESRSQHFSYLHWVQEAIMGLAGSPLSGLSAEAGGTREVLQAVIAVLSVVLPGVFLGAIVFRLFVRERMLVFRKRPSLVRRSAQGQAEKWSLVLRLYPATYLLLLDLSFSVYLQHAREESDGGLVLHNTPLRCLNPRWPVGDTHSPYSLVLDLDDGDVDEDANPPVLKLLQGFDLDDKSQLIVHAVGHIPELATEFSEHHRVHVPSHLEAGGFYGVTVYYDGYGPQWPGWEDFERERRGSEV